MEEVAVVRGGGGGGSLRGPNCVVVSKRGAEACEREGIVRSTHRYQTLSTPSSGSLPNFPGVVTFSLTCAVAASRSCAWRSGHLETRYRCRCVEVWILATGVATCAGGAGGAEVLLELLETETGGI